MPVWYRTRVNANQSWDDLQPVPDWSDRNEPVQMTFTWAGLGTQSPIILAHRGAARPGVFYPGDIIAFNRIISEHGLNLPLGEEDGTMQPNWGNVSWNQEVPRRISWMQLRGQGLQGQLDATELTALQDLDVSWNQLTGIDVTALAELQMLNVSHNEISSPGDVVGLREGTSLTFFPQNVPVIVEPGTFSTADIAIVNNIITEHDLDWPLGDEDGSVFPDWPGSIEWDMGTIPYRITSFSLWMAQEGHLDVSGLTALTSLSVGGGRLTGLDVSGLRYLERLSVWDNRLTELDLTGLTALRELNVGNNRLTELNLRGLTALEELSASGNQLTELDLTGLTALTSLSVSSNQLTELNVSGLIALERLEAENNQFTELDVSGLTTLEHLSVGRNRLTKLDVTGLTALLLLDVTQNFMVSVFDDIIGLTGRPTLQFNPQREMFAPGTFEPADIIAFNRIIAEHNLSSTFGIEDGSVNPEWWGIEWSAAAPRRIVGLNLFNRGLQGHLDVSGLTALQQLRADRNQLIGLNLNELTTLREINVDGNRLTELDVSGLAALTSLGVRDNRLTGLDVTDLTALQTLDVRNNDFTSPNNIYGRREETSFFFLPQNVPVIGILHTGDIAAVNRIITENHSELPLAPADGSEIPAEWQLGSPPLVGFYTAESPWRIVSLRLGGLQGQLHFEAQELTALHTLDVSHGQLTGIDVSGLAALTSLSVSRNNISSPDDIIGFQSEERNAFLPQNVTVTGPQGLLHAGDIAVINRLISENSLNLPPAPADGSELPPEWYWLGVGWNTSARPWRINSLSLRDFQGHLDARELSALTSLHVSGFNLTGVDVTGLTALTSFGVTDSRLTELDVSGLTRLTSLNASNNRLSYLDVGRLTALNSLDVSSNRLTELDVRGLTALGSLSVNRNQLTGINVSGLTALYQSQINNPKVFQV